MGYEGKEIDVDEHALSDMEDGRAIGPSRSRGLSESNLARRVSRLSEASHGTRQRRQGVLDSHPQEEEVPVAVVEQRVSNLAQGCLCLVLMTKPFEHVLGLIPKGVMAGLFVSSHAELKLTSQWYMGTDALLTSGVTQKMLYLIRDPLARSASDPLNKVRKSRIALFTLIELIGFGATFAITQTIAAVGFPVIIMLLVPVRLWIVPLLGFRADELAILDGAVASPFVSRGVFCIADCQTMESVGA